MTADTSHRPALRRVTQPVVDLLKTLLSLIGGVLMSVALLWVVQQLLLQPPLEQRTDRQRTRLEMVELQPPPPPVSSPPEPEMSEPPSPPPPPSLTVEAAPNAALALEQSIEAPELPLARLDPGALDIGRPGPAAAGAAATAPVAISQPRPPYPQSALRRGLEGWVRIEFTVTREGRVQAPRVIESTPANIFDQAALSAVLRWRFKPATEAGQPVERRVVQRIAFEVDR